MTVLALLFSLAHADIAPPRGYVESCTVENYANAERECAACDGYHGGREPCEALEQKGYAQVCKSRGASVWTEVMCKAAAAAPTVPEVVPPPAPPTPAPAPAAPAAPAPTTDTSTGCNTLGGPRVDMPPDPGQGDGCKCATGATPPAWLPLALLILASRRRC